MNQPKIFRVRKLLCPKCHKKSFSTYLPEQKLDLDIWELSQQCSFCENPNVFAKQVKFSEKEKKYFSMLSTKKAKFELDKPRRKTKTKN
ncbi:MAG: hypothetical protein Q7S21_05435 [archaeon]|nr:hypothetical protein [archaeon]